MKLKCADIPKKNPQKNKLKKIFQRKRESVQAWAAMWDSVNKDVQKEMEEEALLDEKTALKSGVEAEIGQEYFQGSKSVKEHERISAIGYLEQIANELKRGERDILEIVDLLKTEPRDIDLAKKIDQKIVSRAAVKKVSGDDDDTVMSGEWINLMYSKIDTETEKTRFRGIMTLLKMILYKIVPFDMSFPMPTRRSDDTAVAEPQVPTPKEVLEEEKLEQERTAMKKNTPKVAGKTSSLDVGQYRVQSRVEKNETGKKIRVWPCPFPSCGIKYGSSRKAQSCLNEHLDRIYECPKCYYTTFSLDNYNHHKCFSGTKTQGGERRHEKPRKNPGRPRKVAASAGSASTEVKEVAVTSAVSSESKKGAVSSAVKEGASSEKVEVTEGSSEKVVEKEKISGSGRGGKRRKLEVKKEEVDEDDIICLDD